MYIPVSSIFIYLLRFTCYEQLLLARDTAAIHNYNYYLFRVKLYNLVWRRKVINPNKILGSSPCVSCVYVRAEVLQMCELRGRTCCLICRNLFADGIVSQRCFHRELFFQISNKIGRWYWNVWNWKSHSGFFGWPVNQFISKNYYDSLFQIHTSVFFTSSSPYFINFVFFSRFTFNAIYKFY